MKSLERFIFIFGICIAYFSYANNINEGEHTRYIEVREITNLCGVNCVYIVQKIYNIGLKYSDIYRSLMPTYTSKVSIADIERVLNEHKIKNHTLKLRPSQLYDNPYCLFIMYTLPPKNSDIGHFSVARVIDENRVQIIDAPLPPKILKKSDWTSNDKIIFIAVGDNFKPPSKLTPLNIIAVIMILGGISLLVYKKCSTYKISK
mgnify:FL=1